MHRKPSERLILLALGLLQGFGPVHSAELLQGLSARGLTIRDLLQLSPDIRRSRLPLPPRLQASLEGFPSALSTARRLERQMAQRGILWITRNDDRYPRRLKHFMGRAAPMLLFLKGNIGLLKAKYFLGIVGTRNPSPKGATLTETISSEIAKKKIVIVSGGAKGIDAAAHRGALKTGATIFVLPYGLFHLARLGKFMARFSPQNHLIISEFPPHERGTRSTPILRNRTVAALSDALCIAETSPRGGALHTLKFARQYSKPILAFDFSPDENPTGNALLIASGFTALPISDGEQKRRYQIILKALKQSIKIRGEAEDPPHLWRSGLS